MPIVDVELVVERGRVVADGLAQSLADAIGDTLHSPQGRTWIRLRLLGKDCYAENDAPREAAVLPVFVNVLQRKPPEGAELAAEVTELTAVIAKATGRPLSCVHVEYAPAAAGRIAFGGRLVE